MAEINPYRQDLDKVVQQLNVPQEGNILITGATGLIGSCLVDLLMRHSFCHIYAMGRNSQRAEQRFADYWQQPRFHFIRHDICQSLECTENFHYIIHAASNASPNFFQQSPVEVMKSNLDGLCHLVEYGLRHQMKRMVYISSGEVYGEGDGSVFTEESS
jgi:nucleoside-diphosphate-sugar epimerase